jgi:hypothetical protein
VKQKANEFSLKSNVQQNNQHPTHPKINQKNSDSYRNQSSIQQNNLTNKKEKITVYETTKGVLIYQGFFFMSKICALRYQKELTGDKCI